MSWSEVRPWYAKYFWEFGVGNPKVPRPFACHGLASDQDMQKVLEFWVANPEFPKVLCMSRSDSGLGILGCIPYLPKRSEKYFALPDMCIRIRNITSYWPNKVRHFGGFKGFHNGNIFEQKLDVRQGCLPWLFGLT